MLVYLISLSKKALLLIFRQQVTILFTGYKCLGITEYIICNFIRTAQMDPLVSSII